MMMMMNLSDKEGDDAYSGLGVLGGNSRICLYAAMREDEIGISPDALQGCRGGA